MFCFLQVFYILLSAFLLALGIPNELYKLGCPIAGLFALFPLYIAVNRSKSYKETFWLFFLHGAFSHLLSSFWLKNFQGMAAFTLGASMFGTACIEAFTSLILYYPFSKKINSAFKVPLKIFWFSGLWVIYEWCKSTGFLAYPWGTLSLTAYNWHIFTQFVDITGVWGISFIFASFSALTGEAVLLLKNININLSGVQDSFNLRNTAKTIFAFTAVIFCYGIYQYSMTRTPVKSLNAVMVQQNMDTYKANEEEAILLSQNLTKEGINTLAQADLKPDLIVWSEGVLGKYFPNSQVYYERFPESNPLMKFIKKQRVPFIIGGALTIDRDKHQYSNCAALIDKNGKFAGAYSKIHLVPFAEAIPFVEYEVVRTFIKKIAGFSYGWTQGKKNTLFEIPVKSKETDLSGTEIITLNPPPASQTKVMVSAPICYDDAFPHVIRGLFYAGCELYMNITNDSWSKTESAEYQHFVTASYRSMEFRTTLARCTNAGYTVVLDPAGKIIDSIPLFEPGSLAMKIPVYTRTETLFCRFGDWLPYSIMTLAAIFIFLFQKHEKDSELKDISTELLTKKRTRRKEKIS